MRVGRLSLLFVVSLLCSLGVLMARPPDGGQAQSPAPTASAPLLVRGIVPVLSRDVRPDIRVESVTLTETLEFGAAFTYRIANVGAGDATLASFTIQAWFSADVTLEKDRDLLGAILSIGPKLRAGEVFEAEALASNANADTFAYPFLIVEVDSGGSVLEDDYANNVGAARRPPADLVSNVVLIWDLAAGVAQVHWDFNGPARGLADLGFRVVVPGFGAQEVPRGTRDLTVPFAPFTGAKPCFARVSPRSVDGYYWPGILSNTLCSTGR